MHINRDRVIVSGYAGSGVQISPPSGDPIMLRPGPNGFPAFLRDDRIVYNAASGEVRSMAALDGSGDQFFMAGGSSPLFASGGHALTFLAGSLGVRTSWDLWRPEAAPLGMAPDGTIFIRTSYQGGYGLEAYRPGQFDPVINLPTARPLLDHFAVLDGGRFLWVDERNALQSFGLPPAAQVESAYMPALAEVDGEAWVCYATQSGRLLLHPLADASRGFVVARGDTFGPLLYSDAPGTLIVAYAGNQGEIGPLSRVFVTLADAQPLAPEDPTQEWPRLGRVGVGGFKVTVNATSSDAPGHFEVLSDGALWQFVARQDRPVMADLMSASSVPRERLLGLFIVVGRDNQAQARAVADRNGVPIFWYYDGFPFREDLIEQSRPQDTWMLMSYPLNPARAIEAELERMRSLHPRLAVAWPLYVRYPVADWSLQDCVALQRPLYDAVRRQGVEWICYFSGPGRYGGIGTYPELARYADGLVRLSDGLPEGVGDPVPSPTYPNPTPDPERPEPEPVPEPGPPEPEPVPDPGIPAPDPGTPAPSPIPSPAPTPIPNPAAPDAVPRARAISEDSMLARLRAGDRYVGVRGTYVVPVIQPAANVLTLTRQEDGRYTAAFVDGRFFCLRPDGTWDVRDQPGPWERFSMVEFPDGRRVLYRIQDDWLVPEVFEIEATT